MKHLILTGMLLTAISSISQNGNWCGLDRILEQRRTSDPTFDQTLHQHFLHAAARSESNAQMKMTTITVPVVVHIIHDNGIGNINTAQVIDALDVLNIDYNRLNADTVDTRNTVNAPFKPVAGGMNIDFRLAKLDPQGNCTNGIVRVNAPHLTYDAGEACKSSANGGSDPWPQDQYFNIWVVNSIDNGGDPGIIAGYAYYPGMTLFPGYGVLIRNDYFGSIGTSSVYNSRVLTHEMGHALDLPHIFDPGPTGPTGCHASDCNASGDYVCDTPPQTEANWSCNPAWNSCDSVPVNDAFGYDVVDQIENYMSYNSCQNMFSLGQVARMQNSFVIYPDLQNMISTANLTLTGAMLPDILCKADFESYKRVICSGSTVEFLDFSYTGQTSWQWSATPGTVGVDYTYVNGTSSTDQNPVMAFLTPGNYDITLTVTDGVGSKTETKTGYIKVLPNYPTLPVIEGFEPYMSLSQTDYWVTTNYPVNNEFEVISGVGHSGNQCVKLENYGQNAGNRDELQSSTVDLSWLDPQTDQMTLSFRYAYRKRNAGNDEFLKVYISATCGENWVQRKTLHGDMLSPSVWPAAWTPSSVNDWVTVHMTNITSNFWTSSFRYMFAFESDGGNNFYLDDINIYLGAASDTLVGIQENTGELNGIEIYPNPFQKEVNVSLNAVNEGNVKIELLDIYGKVVLENEIKVNNGKNIVLLDTPELGSGVYFIVIHTGESTVRRELIRL